MAIVRRVLAAPTASRDTLAKATALMWFVGAVLVAAVVVLQPPGPAASRALLGIAVVAAITGVVTLRLADVLPEWTYHLSSAGGAVAVSAVVAIAGTGTHLELLFLWIITFAALFYSRSGAAAHSVLMLLGYGVALTIDDAPVAVPLLSLASTLAVTVLVIAYLSRASAAARVDPLTGAANRRALEQRLTTELDRARGEQSALSIAVLDIDHFKEINDTHGHAAGDRLLRRIVESWRAHLRPDDFLVRLGGDEFVIVLPGVDVATAAGIVERLRQVPLPYDARASAGVAPCLDGDSMSLALHRADSALYQAKRGGRARTATMGESSQLARELDRALERGELEVHYQPVLRLDDDQVHGLEALARWRHPDRGLLGPDEFIPAAEETDRIEAIGTHVRRQACRQLVTWREMPAYDGLRMAVNVSPLELTADLPEAVGELLDEVGLPGDALVLEITESELPDASAAAISSLAQLSRLGVHLAMDDFGSGYSSLSQLRSLPLAGVKIDRAFITDIHRSAEASSLVEAIVGMAHGLHLGVTAEGVELPEQLDAVRRAGCDLAQGFLLARPMPVEDAGEWLAARTEGREPPAAAVPQRSEDELGELLSDVVEGSTSARGAVEALLAKLAETSGLESVYVTSIDWTLARQRVEQAHNAGRLDVEEGRGVDWSETVCRRALETGPSATPDVEATWGHVPAAAELGIRSYVMAPVTDPGGRVRGTLCGVSSERRPISPELQSLVALFADLVGESLSAVGSAET